ncbi:MAG: pyruvate kinase [Eubacteriales bacterium]|nr:pyruvate kinase [Eubacteriales bacterium]
MEIYGTLGPACGNDDTLAQMLDLGMTGIRLNLSHMSLPQAEPLLEALQQASQRTGISPKLLIDMQGPEIRVGAMSTPTHLIEGKNILLGQRGGIPLPRVITDILQPGMELWMDDGKLRVEVFEARGGLRGRVIQGGVLHSRKSVAIPGCDLWLPALTDTDKENLRAAKEFGVTGLMQPFVRGREDLLAVREELRECGCEGLRLFAKIENRIGLEKLPELMPVCDEVVIARGDLGNAVPLWELPRVQKEIAALCRSHRKAFMVVTQMLTSMEQNPVPTRAEVSDIFNAILDGAASVMVTGETAAGKHPVEVMRYLVATVREAEQYRKKG